MLLLALSFSRSLYENIFVELLLPFFSLVLCGKPMNDVVYFRYYFDKLNLPQTTVLQIEQDKRGFLWLATGHGVYRFDGNEAVPLYEIVPGYDEILKQYISWIMVDETDGLLWMSNGYVFEFETGVLRENRISTEFMQNPPLIDTQGNLWFSFFDRYMKYAPSRDVGTALEVPVGVWSRVYPVGSLCLGHFQDGQVATYAD